MSLIKWNKNTDLDKPFTSLFENFFGRDIGDFMGEWKGTQPAVNVVESPEEFRVEVAVPGMAKEDFDVNLDNDMLIVSCKKEDRKEEENENYMRKEFSYSSFQRSFHLPHGIVASEKIAANYKDGILCVSLPKKEEAKKEHSTKRIDIS